MPDLTSKMNARLTAALTEMKASYPYYNPACTTPVPNSEKVCTVESHQRDGQRVRFVFRERGAKVTRADLIYSLNGGEQYEEWFRAPATLHDSNQVTATLPKGTTHYYLNLIDENQFLRRYPEVMAQKKSKSFAKAALSTRPIVPAQPIPAGKKGKADRNIPFNRWDTNKDQHLSLEEYKSGLAGKPDLEKRFKRFDKNEDGKVSREEFVGRKR